MRRNLIALSNQTFDVLIIGGGIQGACIAWEATLRGLSVALLEQFDFASGTSANSLKVIHGGLRYLQTADLPRMRQSIRARQTLMRIAPHLVHPMPVLVPTYGHGTKGKEALQVALKLNDWISSDRNTSLPDPQKHIPPGQMLSRQACLAQLPDLPSAGLTGAARFHDAQVYNSEQLVLAFLQSAADRGAQVANYTRVVDILIRDGQVRGVVACDQMTDQITDQSTGDRFDIQAKTVINAGGPWIQSIVAKATGTAVPSDASASLAKAMNLITRPLFGTDQQHAIGITGRAPGSRLFFIAPWRGKSIIGTWYGPDTEGIKPPVASSREIADFLQDINQAYPTFKLTPDDVEWVHTGLLPSDGMSAANEMKLTKHFQLIDHRRSGIKGLLSVSAVKYTTAVDVARRAIDWVFRDRAQMPEPSQSHHTPIYGGQIDQFQTFLTTAIQKQAGTISPQTMQRLVYNYGTAYTAVLQDLKPAQSAASEPLPVSDREVIAAEVRYSLKNTMAHTLSDVIFRRSELGSAGHPGDDLLQLCGQVMAQELGWSPERQHLEVTQVQQQLHRHIATEQPSKPVAQPCCL